MDHSLTKYLIHCLKKYRIHLALLAFVGLFWAVANTLLPYLLKVIIDKVVAFEGDKSALFSAIQPYVFSYIFVWFLLCADFRFADWIKLTLFPGLRQIIMSHMFSYLNQHSHRYFQNNFTGSVVNKISDMQSGVVDILTILDEMYAQVLGILIAALTLLWIHPIFALILVGWVLCFLLITYVYLGPVQNLSHIFAAARSSLVGSMVDSIGNIANVRLFSKHRFENDYMDQVIDDTVHKDRQMMKKIIEMRIWWDISIIAMLAIDLILLSFMYGHNKVTVGDFSFIITLSISILWNLWFIASQFVLFTEQVGKCRQALSIINTPHEITDIPKAKALKVKKGEIKFKNVGFHYREGWPLFENLTITLQPGEKIGLVGFSGSGKSTFVNIILRLFEVSWGTIKIDNQDISKVSQDSLRESIALIPQDISLFHRTLMENIRYGRINASDAEVIEASKQAHCHEFISHMACGYQTLVGERGIKLSGGQRQRIAIARAILKNAPILILDEATSALDSVTEKYIHDSLHDLMEGKTTIVIAHRLSTLSEMDRILVFDKGKILEEGTHEELIRSHGHYAKMWQMQAGGFLPEYLGSED